MEFNIDRKYFVNYTSLGLFTKYEPFQSSSDCPSPPQKKNGDIIQNKAPTWNNSFFEN